MAKKGASDALIIVVLLLVVGFLSGYLKLPSMGGDGVSGECNKEITPDITVLGYDIENPSTAVTSNGPGFYRKQGSTAWTAITPGTEVTDLEPFQTYEVILGVSTTVATSDDYDYGPHFFITTKCQEDERIEKAFYIAEEYGGLTGTFYDADDNAAGEVFTAGQTQTVSIKWSAANEQYFGNPYIGDRPNILALQLNSTAWEKPVEVSFTTQNGGGGKLSGVSCPALVDTLATHITYCYEAPVITDTITRFWLKLEADGTVPPTVDDTAYLYAGTWYIDTDKNTVGSGVENNDAAYTAGDGDADSVTLDFT